MFIKVAYYWQWIWMGWGSVPVAVSCSALIENWGEQGGLKPGHNPKSTLPRLSAPFSQRVKGANHEPVASAEPEAASGHEWTCRADVFIHKAGREDPGEENWTRVCDQSRRKAASSLSSLLSSFVSFQTAPMPFFLVAGGF